jgi:hypothetical protein
MALYLTERLTDEGTARMVQLGIEYDPKATPRRHPMEQRGPRHLRPGDRPATAGHPADKPELLPRLTDRFDTDKLGCPSLP